MTPQECFAGPRRVQWQDMRVRLPRRGCVLLVLMGMAAACAPSRAGAGAAHPAAASPAGRWETVDDKTGQVKSIVEIRQVNGELDGRIVKLFNPPAPDPLCLKCTGALKDKPVMGMRILWGMRRLGGEWTGGRILDPESGGIYRCTMTLENGGKLLQVHGYIGFSIFGRTERWVRAADSMTR